MTAPTADCCFWGFLWYLRHNPYKTFGGMTEDDLIATAKLFATENADALSAADPGTYTDVGFPTSLTGAQTTAICDQAIYPEKHVGH